MHLIYLQPTDVLFFRDGRPMSGSLAGHSAAWPLPDVTSHALHAALWRAGFAAEAHSHRRGRSGHYQDDHRDRKFGALATVGPFPVRVLSSNGSLSPENKWFFPRPKDAQTLGSVCVTLQPATGNWRKDSSLPLPLLYAVANTQAPDKNAGGEPWISRHAYEAYLRGDTFDRVTDFLEDEQIADREAQIGIAIDPETQTTGRGSAEGQIYSAHYLRLREGFRLGLVARAEDKRLSPEHAKHDLILDLLDGRPARIVVGGQQRVCTATREDAPTDGLPLPRGLTGGFTTSDSEGRRRWLVKWVLLSPALWPEIRPGVSPRGTTVRGHPGGWLPNWISPETGAVLLRTVPEAVRKERRSLNYSGKGYNSEEGTTAIGARLVAALVPKPLVVTGWALPNDTDRSQGGAKSTHLAVPAGAVYYFEAESEASADALANALNWHGEGEGSEIKNRRSTLMGEKGFGLGVCGTWEFCRQSEPLIEPSDPTGTARHRTSAEPRL